MNVQKEKGKICEHAQKRLSSVIDCFSFSASVELRLRARRIPEILEKVIDKGGKNQQLNLQNFFHKVQLWVCYWRQLRSGLKFDV